MISLLRTYLFGKKLMKHVLFRTKEEHWDWCYKNYFRYCGDFDASPWEEEDRKIMQPFFDWQEERKGAPEPMPPDVQTAFNHYCRISEKGMDARERIDVVRRIGEDHLLDIFGFERKYESDFETDEEYEAYLDREAPPELAIELAYPCIMVYSLSASFDRCGDVTEALVDYVELKEFDGSVEQLNRNITDRRVWASASTWLNPGEALAVVPINTPQATQEVEKE